MAPPVRRGSGSADGGAALAVDLRPAKDLKVVRCETARELAKEFDAIQRTLADTRGEWKERVGALKRLQSLTLGCAQADSFVTLVMRLREALAVHVQDLRSSVARETCTALFVLVHTLGAEFEPLALALLPALFKISLVTVQIISESGFQCACAIVRECCTAKVLRAVIEQLPSKSGTQRWRCSQALLVALQTHPMASLERNVDALEDAIHQCMEDARDDVRSCGRSCFWLYFYFFEERAEGLRARLDSARRRQLDAARPEKLGPDDSMAAGLGLSFDGNPASSEEAYQRSPQDRAKTCDAIIGGATHNEVELNSSACSDAPSPKGGTPVQKQRSQPAAGESSGVRSAIRRSTAPTHPPASRPASGIVASRIKPLSRLQPQRSASNRRPAAPANGHSPGSTSSLGACNLDEPFTQQESLTPRSAQAARSHNALEHPFESSPEPPALPERHLRPVKREASAPSPVSTTGIRKPVIYRPPVRGIQREFSAPASGNCAGVAVQLDVDPEVSASMSAKEAVTAPKPLRSLAPASAHATGPGMPRPAPLSAASWNHSEAGVATTATPPTSNSVSRCGGLAESAGGDSRRSSMASRASEGVASDGRRTSQGPATPEGLTRSPRSSGGVRECRPQSAGSSHSAPAQQLHAPAQATLVSGPVAVARPRLPLQQQQQQAQPQPQQQQHQQQPQLPQQPQQLQQQQRPPVPLPTQQPPRVLQHQQQPAIPALLARCSPETLQVTLRALALAARTESSELWEKHFGRVLILVLDALPAEDPPGVRDTALFCLQELVTHLPQFFEDFAEIVASKLFDMYRGGQENRLRIAAVDNTLERLTGIVAPLRALDIVLPVLGSDAKPALQAAARLLSTVLQRMPKRDVLEQLDTVLPGIVTAFGHESSEVRKAAVFCLVDIYMILGEACMPHLARDLTRSQMKLVTIYIGKQNPEAPESQGGAATDMAERRA
eukprot:TRINITY_DN2840_c0_g2_i2.p1 TRINITY_DN2840_c0_g2~~TRINITY_DN2840_c0_g2_i2.p1  ORF type:complete len:979 (+),score=165.24 TRINITY_DN2840_c0_g2_i2:73-2937(+)